MPKIKKKDNQHTQIKCDLCYAEAVGNIKDFYAIAYCPELDDIEKNKNKNHFEYSIIYHFINSKRHEIVRLNKRIDALWKEPSGIIIAAGNTNGYIEISGDNVNEVAFENINGQFHRFFGIDQNHLYACGGFSPFFQYRKYGEWHRINLPEGCPTLWSIGGFNEREIFIVGDEGTILFFDGKKIEIIESPTDRRLTSIVKLNNDFLCIGGYGGTLLMGNKKGWRFVPTNTESPILKIAEYKTKIFYGAEGALWSFDGKNSPLEEFDKDVRWISSLDDGLFLGNGEAYLYCGGELEYIDNVIIYQP
jgi:hypothetical protein